MTPPMPLATSSLLHQVLPVAGSQSSSGGRMEAVSLSVLILTIGLGMAFAGGLGYASLRKDVTIIVAGQPLHRTTFQRTVGQSLAEAGIVVQANDEVIPSLHGRLTEGQTVVVLRAVPFTMTVDGKTLQVESAAATVGDLLLKRGITLGRWDKVFPSLEAPLARGMNVRVVRIEHTQVIEQIEIPYRVQMSADPATPRGVVRVLVPGRAGVNERLFDVIVADGVDVQRRLIDVRVVRSPLDRVVTIGSLVQIASRGPFAGREFFDMVATAYSPFCCRGVDDVTALGMQAGYGVVAVDPRVIPLGSSLYVEGYGYAIAGDTGSAIKGLRIDLGFETKREALRFGRRPVRVYVIAKKDR